MLPQKTCTAARLAFLMSTAIPLVCGSPINELLKIMARDPPTALPERATVGDKAFQPAMDFDTDGCYNTPAIDADGNVAPGLDHDNTGLSEGCRDPSDLVNNNVYSRARCNNGWCAYLYDYYFEKDVAIPYFPLDLGHRHDWEHIVVFTQGDVPQVVAVSQHGEYETRAAADVRWDDGGDGDGGLRHPKVVYHKDGVSTHNFRFATAADDDIENASGRWFYGPLVSYNGFPSAAIRDKLMAWDFGDANVALKDASYPGQLERARGDKVDAAFDSNVDDGSPGDP
ncbi:NPP1-domain-containing protein [Biscogniauxia sp. FL1348]|nr:NPP1-domain-containing protein [Biscogniauxia sp. FL1348]